MKKHIVYIILLLNVSLALSAKACIPSQDTISSPPGFPIGVAGATSVCEGETTMYFADIPIGCQPTWYINGELQVTGGDTLQVFWLQSGAFLVTMELLCDTLTFTTSELEVEVGGLPEPPFPIEGDEVSCLYATSVYTTTVGSGVGCLWKLDGVVQLSDSSQLVCSWSSTGGHELVVYAVDSCGISDSVAKQVMVSDWPVVDLGNDTTLIDGQSVVLDAENTGCHYLWSTGDTTQSIVVTTSGSFQVWVSNVCGEVSDEIRVDVISNVQQKTSVADFQLKYLAGQLSFGDPKQLISQVSVYDVKGQLVTAFEGDMFACISSKSFYVIRVVTIHGETVIMKLATF